MVIECDHPVKDISHHDSIYGGIFQLNLDKFHARMNLSQSTVINLELKLLFRDRTLSSIEEFLQEILEPCITYLKNDNSHIHHFTDPLIKSFAHLSNNMSLNIQNHLHAL
ncbi:unnamed protein product [Adineta ricciae]|uniref:Uncharacterized protein n=1 Tax=Adineta ricciae TaxID=249248 RepID=A0A815UWJ8_ADIRI|nr:unnamed protein product [Adineta ricciae]CAF1522745.1 unnamed protein product [Adineta ricciae]